MRRGVVVALVLAVAGLPGRSCKPTARTMRTTVARRSAPPIGQDLAGRRRKILGDLGTGPVDVLEVSPAGTSRQVLVPTPRTAVLPFGDDPDGDIYVLASDGAFRLESVES